MENDNVIIDVNILPEPQNPPKVKNPKFKKPTILIIETENTGTEEHTKVIINKGTGAGGVQVETLTKMFSSLAIKEYNINNIIKIQKWFRGCILRLKQLPLIMYKLQKYLKLQAFQFSKQNEDGRVNSCIDGDEITKLLINKFGNKIKKPKIRMWYDILAFDYMYGWLPINIKTTTTITSDNTGNLAMCVYAYIKVSINNRRLKC